MGSRRPENSPWQPSSEALVVSTVAAGRGAIQPGTKAQLPPFPLPPAVRELLCSSNPPTLASKKGRGGGGQRESGAASGVCCAEGAEGSEWEREAETQLGGRRPRRRRAAGSHLWSSTAPLGGWREDCRDPTERQRVAGLGGAHGLSHRLACKPPPPLNRPRISLSSVLPTPSRRPKHGPRPVAALVRLCCRRAEGERVESQTRPERWRRRRRRRAAAADSSQRCSARRSPRSSPPDAARLWSVHSTFFTSHTSGCSNFTLPEKFLCC